MLHSKKKKKMKRKNLIKGFLYFGIISFGVSCTNLDEEVLDGQFTKKKAYQKCYNIKGWIINLEI